MSGKTYHDDLMDKGLEQVSNSANWLGGVLKMTVCAGKPATVTEASTLFPTGKRVSDEISITAGNVSLGARAGGGREVTLVAKSGTVGVNVPALDSGTATAGSATTLTDTGKAWSTNAFAGKVARITGGTGAGQVGYIASNTATVLTFSNTLGTALNATSIYEVREDLHIAIYDGSGSPRLLVVNEETGDQVLTSGNPVNIPEQKFGFAPPA